MNPVQRHERFTYSVAADPELQIEYEAGRDRQREMMLGGIDYIEGVPSLGASAFVAERNRLQARVSEAKRRALVGADPLNLTGHSKGNASKPDLAADPVERVGHITRTVPAHARMKGKNKLDARQSLVADEYRDAYEMIRSSLGGVMDFDRPRGGSASPSSPAEAVLMASQKLRAARALIGQRAILVIEHIVCQGRTVEECARIMYGYQDGQATASRDVNYVGRALREALHEIASAWHPIVKRPPIRGTSASRLDQVVGAAGVMDVTGKPYVMGG